MRPSRPDPSVGHPFAVAGLATAACPPRWRAAPSGGAAIPPNWEWTELWAQVEDHLRRSGYRKTSRRLYRNVLRGFRTHSRCRPSEITRAHIRAYLRDLAARRLSASWIGMNLAVLRTVFDRFFEGELTRNLAGPKRSRRLPEILRPETISALLADARTPRDRLLVGLLYGCGLRVGEVCRLRWRDLDPLAGSIRVRHRLSGSVRTLRLPRDLVPVLDEGSCASHPEAFVFPGRRPGARLSVRMAEHIIYCLGRDVSPGLRITSFSLRHAYAVHSLEAGMNIRELQEALGHLHLDTTMRYLRLLLPPDAVSPLDLWENHRNEPETPAKDPLNDSPQTAAEPRSPRFPTRARDRTAPGFFPRRFAPIRRFMAWGSARGDPP